MNGEMIKLLQAARLSSVYYGETFLWEGKVEQARALLERACPKRGRNFLAYIEKHQHRLPNYQLLQTEHYISISSGAVESAIKRTSLMFPESEILGKTEFCDRRLKISGAQWNANSVSPMLRLRCAYLNQQITA